MKTRTARKAPFVQKVNFSPSATRPSYPRQPDCLALNKSTKRNNKTGKNGRSRIYAVVVIASVVLLLVGVAVYYDQMSTSRPNVTDTSTTAAKFRALSQAHTDTCANIGNKQANIN